MILRTIVDSADHRFQIGLVGDVQNDAEFIASVPGDEIAGSETALEQLCDCLQGVIAYAVSICVVNVLESIRIAEKAFSLVLRLIFSLRYASSRLRLLKPVR